MSRQDNVNEAVEYTIKRINDLINSVERQKQINLARSHYPFFAKSLRGNVV